MTGLLELEKLTDLQRTDRLTAYRDARRKGVLAGNYG